MNAQNQAIEAATAPQSGAVIDIPLNKLKKSPKNARKVPHSTATIESRAASIEAKGLIQPLVVEPEFDEAGAPTGFWLVTVGESRRLAYRLLASRKRIKKTHPVQCKIDTVNDPLEISLDENVSRSDMHPADQFEAFRDLNERKGWGAEEIGARFGVTPQIVRQRLRLGAVSPRLIGLYREEGLTLDQLMAFAVSEDHARQEQVFDQCGDRHASYIRRAMTEAKVSAQDKRALFVGAEAYAEAGGTILRDLFTEDGGGWFEDIALLDRLAVEKLTAQAEAVQAGEGWKWAEAHIDYPRTLGFARVYAHRVERPEAEAAEIAALGEEYDAIVSAHDGAEEWPAEVEAKLAEIEAALEAFGDGTAYLPEEIARAGVFVVLGQDGVARIERGIVRPDDIPAPEPETEDQSEEATASNDEPLTEEVEEPEGDVRAPLPDRLVLDLTAHRTAALRDALAEQPTVALTAVAHSLVLSAFYPHQGRFSCLEIEASSQALQNHAPDVEDGRAAQRIAERHAAWASRLPQAANEAWAFLCDLPGGELLDLLAHCASLSLNALHMPWDRRAASWEHADALAQAVGLDMGTYWTTTAASYLGRVTKARIAEAVSEGVSAEAALRISSLKKPDMAAEAETLLAGTGWLPSLLRAPVVAAVDETASVAHQVQDAA